MRKLNKLTKDNILNFRLEGKNKIFFIKKNLESRTGVFNAEHYKLTKLIRAYPKLSVIIEDILTNSSDNLIILFGSYAKFIPKTESDIDVYIETENKKIKKKLESINSKIRVKMGRFDKKSPLIKEIINNHIIIKGIEQFYEKTEFFK